MAAAEQLITDNLDIWTSAVQMKSAAGRGKNNKLELYGIKKLRELILELAVRGLLVPQDPNDEPASELLKKIAAEKAQLVKDKKIKKPKDLPPIEDDERPFDLPEAWEWARLPDVCSYGPGKTPSTKNPVYWEEAGVGHPWVSISDMTHYETVLNTAKCVSKDAAEKVFKSDPVKAGTLLMSFKLTVGKIAKLGIDAYHNEAIISIQPFKGISQDYIFRFLPGRALAGNTKQAIMGATLNSKSLAMLLIPIPPESEQARIVAKVGELMVLCDQLEQQQETSITAQQILVQTLLDALTKASEREGFTAAWTRIADQFDTLFITEWSIDQLKQTILQLAVMGRLVPQDPNDEPASELLKKIAAEKSQLVRDGKIKKQKALPAIEDDEKPFELPEGWDWCRVWDVADTITSGSRDWAKYYSDSGAIFLTMGNLSRGSYQLRLDTIRYVNPPDDGEGKRTRLEEKDLLISITGDVGNLGLIPANFGEAYINQHTALLRFMPDCQDRYFPELMRTPLAKYQFDAPQRGVKNSFRLGDVGEMVIPIAPTNERLRIVAKVDELMAVCDTLKAKIGSGQALKLQFADAISERSLGHGMAQ